MEIPNDVAWVMAIRYVGYCGLDTCKKIQDIIDRNPLWFPWEHRYKHIPQEVHEAYFKEKHPNWGVPLELGKGIYELMNQKPKKIKKQKKQSVSEMMEDLFKHQEKDRKRRIKERNKAKKLWDKYYKQYNLEYRG